MCRESASTLPPRARTSIVLSIAVAMPSFASEKSIEPELRAVSSSEMTRTATPRRWASQSALSMRSSEMEKMATSREVVAEASILQKVTRDLSETPCSPQKSVVHTVCGRSSTASTAATIALSARSTRSVAAVPPSPPPPPPPPPPPSAAAAAVPSPPSAAAELLPSSSASASSVSTVPASSAATSHSHAASPGRGLSPFSCWRKGSTHAPGSAPRSAACRSTEQLADDDAQRELRCRGDGKRLAPGRPLLPLPHWQAAGRTQPLSGLRAAEAAAAELLYAHRRLVVGDLVRVRVRLRVRVRGVRVRVRVGDLVRRVEVHPKALELGRVRTHSARVVRDEDVLTVACGRGRGPVVRAGEQQPVVDDAVLVVHVPLH
eukprot:scaffold6440_cov68-Phaeocystis_antarctica.AAC.4